MPVNFAGLDYEILERLYVSKSRELEKALLSGTAWDEVKIKRKQLSEMSIAMHDKLQQRHSPAEFPLRKDDERGNRNSVAPGH